MRTGVSRFGGNPRGVFATVASCGCPKDLVEAWVAIAAQTGVLDVFNQTTRSPPKTCLMSASAAGDIYVVEALLRHGASARERNVSMSICPPSSSVCHLRSPALPFPSAFPHFSLPNYTQASATHNTYSLLQYGTYARTCRIVLCFHSLFLPPLTSAPAVSSNTCCISHFSSHPGADILDCMGKKAFDYAVGCRSRACQIALAGLDT